MLSRDLEMARKSYKAKDVDASKKAHDALMSHSEESHQKAGEFLKSIVFGGMDGIVTTFAVVAGATGGGFGVDVILVLGFSNIFADALSMGIGDALSTKAENEYILNERSREKWEFDNNKAGEIKEMVEIYVNKFNMTLEDAELIVNTYAKYDKEFIDLMVYQELGLNVPDPDDNPFYDGLVTFLSFLFFGAFPLLAYVIFAQNPSFSQADCFLIACIITTIMFFVLGVIKTNFTAQSWYEGGAEVTLMGVTSAASAYGIGAFVEFVFVLLGTQTGHSNNCNNATM